MVPNYHEVQRIRQIWIWLLLLIIAGLVWYGFIVQILLHRPFGTNPAPDFILIFFWLIIGVGLPLFLFFTKLITEVRDDGIFVQLFPLHWSFRKIAFDELKSYEVRTYHPIREYGGWGIRIGSKGLAYNISGNTGVQLILKNGKRILIGSQKAEELFRAIHNRVAS